MKNVYQLAAEFRAKILARDAAARAELLRAYQQAFQAIENEITKVATQIITTNGSKALFVEQRRLAEMQRQVARAIANLGQTATSLTTNSQQWAVTAARHEAIMLLEAQAAKLVGPVRMEILGSFDQVPLDVIRQLVGVSHGNPIHEVFSALAKEIGNTTAGRIKEALVKGVTLGESPDRVSKRIIREADAKEGNSQRPPVVVRRLHSAVRNETFRAYREATRLTYSENSDVVKKWRWVSRLSPTTCVICWARDGKTFAVSKPFQSHPNCRCVMTPVVDEHERYKTGAQRFDDLEVGVQRSILGDRAYAAFASGQIPDLEDFVGMRQSKQWGPVPVRLSLDDLLKQRKKAA